MMVSQTVSLFYNASNPDPSYSKQISSAIMILGCLSIGFLSFEAIIKGNEYKFLGFIFMSIIVIFRSAFQFIRINILTDSEEPKWFSMFLPLYCTIQFFQFIVAIPVFRSFKWKIFRIVGTSPQLKRVYQIYTTIMRLDLESALVLVLIKLFMLDLGEIQNQITTVLTSIELVLTVILAPISIYFGVRRELKIIQIPYMLWNFVLPIHAVYQIVVIWAIGDPLINPYYEDPLEAKILITLFCLVFLVIRLSMIFIGIWVVRNFGYGLKDKVYGKDGIFGDYWRGEEITNWIVNDVNEEFNSTTLPGGEKEMDDFKKDSLRKNIEISDNIDKTSSLENIPLD
eukprot:gene4824-8410_t